MSYSIKFEKHKDYQRFNLTGVIVEANKYGDFSIEFYEDIEQTPDYVTYFDDDHPNVLGPDAEYNRTLYAGATLPAYRIPHLIQTLQNKLDAYNAYLNNQSEGNEDE